MDFTHLDAEGKAVMVDVSSKPRVRRTASATGMVLMQPGTLRMIGEKLLSKGDALAVARVAGIAAAKQTSQLIPLCHNIRIDFVAVDLALGNEGVQITARAVCTESTGIEMEALTAVSVAALTLYDMIKAVDKGAVIEMVRLIAKSGGKSGSYKAPAIPAKSSSNRPRPKTLMGEVAAPRPAQDQRRDAFLAFMTSRRLRPTLWAKQAGIASGEILSFLTGRSRGLTPDAAEKLARAAKVRVEDMFR